MAKVVRTVEIEGSPETSGEAGIEDMFRKQRVGPWVVARRERPTAAEASSFLHYIRVAVQWSVPKLRLFAMEDPDFAGHLRIP
ncbi:MAG: hypothetical protein C0467_25015 [Planctomycetaceae bacterium]|nr:hypothetical protein [Planctomycetaceae bacterium]